jgi:sigma-B regulation protein RsbU (phosphoserine phosphatase)
VGTALSAVGQSEDFQFVLTPLFLYATYGLARGFDNIPEKYWIGCFLPMALFPITLAFVIVVQRALDVRVVIRQGLPQIIAVVVILGAATLATDPSRNGPQKIQAIAWGVFGVLAIRHGSERLRGWVDRRFFREAYNAEKILRELSDQVRTMAETGPPLETVSRQTSASLHGVRHLIHLVDSFVYETAIPTTTSGTPRLGSPLSAGAYLQ